MSLSALAPAPRMRPNSDASAAFMPLRSRPQHFRRQRHQNRVGVAAGLEAEQCAAVVEQVELDITAAADQLAAALLVGPVAAHVAAHDLGIAGKERFADRAGEAEILVPVAGVEMVVEDAAKAARLLAVRQVEIFVAPLLVARIVAGVGAVAGTLERGVEVGGVLAVRLRKHRRQVGAAAEPALAGHDVPRVHVDGRHVGRAHVRDQRDAAGPEGAAFSRAGDLLAELLAEAAEHRGDVDPDLLEHAALHHRHGAAAAVAAAGVGPLPGGALEPAGGQIAVTRRGKLVLQPLEGGADPVAQLLEPRARLALMVRRIGAHDSGNPSCRIASPATIAAAIATLSDRRPARIGIRMRRSAAACTSSGTPALSRPSSSESDASNRTSVWGTAALVVSRTSRPGVPARAVR